MRLELKRTTYTRQSTIGELSVDGKFECYVLEDVVRGPGEAKVYGKTAIPAGTYQVRVTYSNRFRKLMPLLVNVPGGTIRFGPHLIDDCGVRIHAGNDQFATEGCLLVGTYDPNKPNWISNSREAFARLYPKIEMAAKIGAVTLTIK